MISWSNLNIGHVGLKGKSLGQICLKPCSLSRSQRFVSILIIFYLNVCLDDILVKFDLGHVGSKTRSKGRISLKLYSSSRGHRFSSIFMELYQII